MLAAFLWQLFFVLGVCLKKKKIHSGIWCQKSWRLKMQRELTYSAPSSSSILPKEDGAGIGQVKKNCKHVPSW